MDGIIVFFFAISACFFFGMFHYFLATQRSGVYPPKYVLKQRAVFFAATGTVFFLIGLLFFLFR